MHAAARNGYELGEPAGARAADQLALRAHVLASRPAGEAVAARHLRVDGDARPDQVLARRAAGGNDLAAELMTHDQRRLPPRAARCDAVQVGAADPGRLDAH